MKRPVEPPRDSAEVTSRIMFFTMLGLIVAFILVFLILHPDPGGGGHKTSAAHAKTAEK
jgi:hypothetical protein